MTGIGELAAPEPPAPASAGMGDEVPLREPGHLDAFISYPRRLGVTEFVDRLAGELSARGKSVWVDRKRIEAAAEWRARIWRGIQGADALIFVLSPESAVSTECLHELDIAVSSHKRVIPVVYEDVDPASLPEALTAPNWICFHDCDVGSEALEKVVEALESDLEWHDAHTRLAGRANEWSASKEDASFLLRGTDLRRAEAWYADKGHHKEQPTPAQLEYIAASRGAASKRQRRLFLAVAAALLVSLVLSTLALVSRQQAIREAHQAQSIAMAVEATDNLSDYNWPLGILLSVEAGAG